MIHLRFLIRLFIIGLMISVLSADILVSESPDIENRIQIQSQRIANFDSEDVSRSIFGSLKFRGGLVLTSSDPRFGGISALRIQPDGTHFLALSDRAYWLRGVILYDGKKSWVYYGS